SYLTLENPHHQRQACIKTCRHAMARRIISARYYICCAASPSPPDRSRRSTAMRHGIDLKPIHNVKDAGRSRWPTEVGSRVFISGVFAVRRTGGAYRDRTDDLKLAKLALSQLS